MTETDQFNVLWSASRQIIPKLGAFVDFMAEHLQPQYVPHSPAPTVATITAELNPKTSLTVAMPSYLTSLTAPLLRSALKPSPIGPARQRPGSS
ncbi:hypothetical protein RP75_23735 (plasmid) [Agrobacterium arsenijevicii]|uniref:LysR family transcriptional regulator n=1 Tax=Agrobacterium arsenijevicii TaxID=1585697 RepID=A0ABR5D1P9_9HYPH|nr:hypothetical protein RP75_23735 [Agrobacterium arsenijevicii]